MQSELEAIVQNLVVQLAKKDNTAYPLLNVYRHHMDLSVSSNDQLHAIFDNIDMNNENLRDLFLCCGGTEVVTLHDSLLGLRLNSTNDNESRPGIYWLKCNSDMQGTAMSDFYDTVKGFITNLNESQVEQHRISLGQCGTLITWRTVLNHIINDPSNALFGCLDHPRRFFTPSTELYTSARNNRDTLVIPKSGYISEHTANLTEPRWFTVQKYIKYSDVL